MTDMTLTRKYQELSDLTLSSGEEQHEKGTCHDTQGQLRSICHISQTLTLFTTRGINNWLGEHWKQETNKGGNCGAASVGVLQDNLALSTRLIMRIGRRKRDSVSESL